MENDLVKIILEIQRDVSSTKESVETLTGPYGRIKQLEDAQTRQWVSSLLSPFAVVAYAVARKLGVNI